VVLNAHTPIPPGPCGGMQALVQHCSSAVHGTTAWGLPGEMQAQMKPASVNDCWQVLSLQQGPLNEPAHDAPMPRHWPPVLEPPPLVPPEMSAQEPFSQVKPKQQLATVPQA
jgi:hypothetical protein